MMTCDRKLAKASFAFPVPPLGEMLRALEHAHYEDLHCRYRDRWL
jgi:hypothetical protein